MILHVGEVRCKLDATDWTREQDALQKGASIYASVLRWISTVTSPGRGGRSLYIKETGVTVRNLFLKSGMHGLYGGKLALGLQ